MVRKRFRRRETGSSAESVSKWCPFESALQSMLDMSYEVRWKIWFRATAEKQQKKFIGITDEILERQKKLRRPAEGWVVTGSWKWCLATCFTFLPPATLQERFCTISWSSSSELLDYYIQTLSWSWMSKIRANQ